MLHLDTILFLKYRFPIVRAYLLEDALISETCALEESASHHSDNVDRLDTFVMHMSWLI